MLKYVDAKVVFSEIPDEITLAINISNCPCHCKGCHSAYLAEDVGKELVWNLYASRIGEAESLHDLIGKNPGISCVALMGGDGDPKSINRLAREVQWQNKNVKPPMWTPIKVAWYSGRQELSSDINLENFDYIKLGPYVEELGPLNSKTTNQRMYHIDNNCGSPIVKDITSRFWKNDT